MKTISPKLISNVAIFFAVTSAHSQAPVESITVERGPCHGTCPVYRFSVRSDGTGQFEGLRFTTAAGQHSFVVTPEAWAAFRTALAPYRPEGSENIVEGHTRCRQMATDHPSVSVTWYGTGRVDQLRFNYGCIDQANETMARTFADAPYLLPVGGLIERIRLQDGEYHGRK
jgi:hypothetical protein